MNLINLVVIYNPIFFGNHCLMIVVWYYFWYLRWRLWIGIVLASDDIYEYDSFRYEIVSFAKSDKTKFTNKVKGSLFWDIFLSQI